MKTVSRIVQAFLWNARFVTIIAVAASLIASLALFYVACLDIGALLGSVAHYTDRTMSEATREDVRYAIITHAVEVADTFLFALVLFIFALGIYELFIDKIEAIESSTTAGRVLLIRSLDDLKERLAKVIFLILIVNYFEWALDRKPQSSLDVLYLAAGVALVAFGIYFTKSKPAGKETSAE